MAYIIDKNGTLVEGTGLTDEQAEMVLALTRNTRFGNSFLTTAERNDVALWLIERYDLRKRETPLIAEREIAGIEMSCSVPVSEPAEFI